MSSVNDTTKVRAWGPRQGISKNTDRADTLGGQGPASSLALGATVVGSLWLTVTVALDPLTAALHRNSEYAVTAAAVGMISLLMIFVDGRRSAYSIFTIHWIFCYIFLFLAPLAQYSKGTFPWGGVTTTDYGTLIHTNYVIIVWMMCWCGVSACAPRNYKTIRTSSPTLNVGPLQRQIALAFIASVAVAIYLFHTKGVNGLLVRGATDTGTPTGSSVDLIVGYFGRAIPVALVVLCATANKLFRTTSWRMVFLSACSMCIVVNFPTSTARFWAAALAIGLLIHLGAIRNKWILQAVISVGIAFLLPLLGAARHATTWTAFIKNLSDSSSTVQSLTTGDFDAYAMVASTTRYVDTFGATSGHQGLSAIFFFVPRSAWPDKGVGSGSLVATGLGLPFTNVSCPLPAEALINFGPLGLIVFALTTAVIARKVEDAYWTGNSNAWLAYPFIVGLSIFIMRGDMLSSFAYSASLLLACFVVTAGVFQKSTSKGRLKQHATPRSNVRAGPVGLNLRAGGHAQRARTRKSKSKAMRTRTRVLLGATDQGLSSLSNIILVIVIARTASIDHFGTFSFAWAIITTVLTVLRGYLGNSVSIALDTSKRRRETRYGLTVAVAVGLLTALSSAAAVWLLGGFGAGYVIAIFAPIVFMQDLLRFHTVAEGQPHLAVVGDGVWTGAMVVVLGIIVVWPHILGPETAVTMWGLAGFASMVFLILAARAAPMMRGTLLWIRSDLTNRIHFGIVGALGAVGALMVISVATLIMGVHATAALRGASSVMGPLNVVMTAIPMVIVPEIRRRGATSQREIWKHIRTMGYALAALALLTGIGISTLPASAGKQLLGDSWPSIQPLLPVTGSEYAGLVLMAVAGAALRASDDGKNLMLVRLVKTIVGIGLGTSAALLIGTPISVSIAISASAALGFVHLLFIINADGSRSAKEAPSGESSTSH